MTDSTQQTMDQATGVARAVGEAVGKKVEEVADKSKQAGADAVAGLGRTASTIADSVAEQSPAIADYVRGAGEKIDRLATDLRDKKVGDLMTSAVEFGRSQPVVMIAGAALVGFALSRLIKAGVAAPSDSNGPSSDSQGGAGMMLNTPRRPGVVTLFTAAIAQSADLVQTEFRLARAEVSEKLAALRVGLALMAVGAIFLIVALGMLLQALVSVLIASGMSPPAAILLVAGGAAVIGLVLFLMGQKRLSPEELVPDRTLTSLSRDGRMMKETVT